MLLNIRSGLAGFLATLLLSIAPIIAHAKPRPPGPPFPEPWRMFDANFDEPYWLGITNLSAYPQYSDYIENWSGYALNRSGSTGTFVDITATDGTTTVRIQTVSTMADGVTPTAAEEAAATRIRDAFPNDQLILIPKWKKL